MLNRIIAALAWPPPLLAPIAAEACYTGSPPSPSSRISSPPPLSSLARVPFERHRSNDRHRPKSKRWRKL